jgi:hypothetical protein
VVNAVLNVAALFRVQAYRMQSRQFVVAGEGGRERPFFVGQWNDLDGNHHYAGMSDVLLTPRIKFPIYETHSIRLVVPLWVEAKSGNARLSDEQEAFRDNAIAGGAYWLECRDSADALLAWFEEHGVER